MTQANLDLLMIGGSRLLQEEVQKKEVDGEDEHGCGDGGFLIVTFCKRADCEMPVDVAVFGSTLCSVIIVIAMVGGVLVIAVVAAL
ncbi:hypothetical protein E3N88_30837 [Mikania micrantha]|uniref:Uncharacterized protein n=1 Tax=Mikania micrantha TaxID=192012 RepID=A0A5N6MN79_9ASTR|nr:hypothetical protein E3N88_30837 [Mikania micrantha]